MADLLFFLANFCHLAMKKCNLNPTKDLFGENGSKLSHLRNQIAIFRGFEHMRE
jgi:hypothetical protein